ncbi:aquaporin-9-like protein [Leptotrombidium deliense]|uniref:Aquaporin-9-like protein n=1 Tax=Leptotrombidium deliense TaxID=299467 RepID=A0A443SB58_9ACAR|nr:aquaporin-9-like protein [Leptotrombidium deliense]
MYAVMLLIDEKHPYYSKLAAKPAIGFLLCAVVMCFELNAGAAINPPRDVVGRIFLLLAGYGSESFTVLDGYYWWTAGLVGPHLGAIAGAWIYYLSIEMHHDDVVVHPLK